jgi:hypothetical protein
LILASMRLVADLQHLQLMRSGYLAIVMLYYNIPDALLMKNEGSRGCTLLVLVEWCWDP